MKDLHIIVSNKVATYLNRDGDIVCGNSDYRIVFAFDNEWEGYDAKTARFFWNDKYLDVAFSGDTVSVPTISNARFLMVGVYVNDILRTTTPAEIACTRSILCISGEAQEPDYQENGGKIEYRLPMAGEKDDGKILSVEGGAYVLKSPDETVDLSPIEKQIEELNKEIADLKYYEISISNFSANPSTAEMGSTVTSVELSWGRNKIPTTLTLDGESIEPLSSSITVTGEFKSDKTWLLKATDERGAYVIAPTSLTFLNGIYYGVGATFDISKLTKKLSNVKSRTITVNAGEGEYIWYAVPSRLGTCSFKVGGFDGGFSLVSTESVTNTSNYAEEYYIYRSVNASLGSITVAVSS